MGAERRVQSGPVMLDAFVIEEIKRRERERDDRPSVQIPLPPPADNEGASDEPPKPDRSVVIIDYS